MPGDQCYELQICLSANVRLAGVEAKALARKSTTGSFFFFFVSQRSAPFSSLRTFICLENAGFFPLIVCQFAAVRFVLCRKCRMCPHFYGNRPVTKYNRKGQ